MLSFGQHPKLVLHIPVHLIDANPAQPRTRFPGGEISSLADSIAENGLLQPISVRKLPNGRYELIAGERRLRAFLLLGERTIPALVEKLDDKTAAVLALVENLQRSDLTFHEEAIAISRLLTEQKLTQQQLAASLGLSQSAIANKLRILRLPAKLLEQLCEAGLGERHARALLPLCADKRLQPFSKQVIRQGLTVEKIEQLVAQMLAEKQTGTPKRLLILKDLRIFDRTIQKAVDIMQQAGIRAETGKTEDDCCITYTITVSKDAPQKTSSRFTAV